MPNNGGKIKDGTYNDHVHTNECECQKWNGCPMLWASNIGLLNLIPCEALERKDSPAIANCCPHK